MGDNLINYYMMERIMQFNRKMVIHLFVHNLFKSYINFTCKIEHKYKNIGNLGKQK